MLQLIRVHKEETFPETNINWEVKYKGAMTKEPLSNTDAQIKELRDAWE